MNRLEALTELAAKVKAGELPEAVFHGCYGIRGHWAYRTGLDGPQRRNVFLAYSGSLDAVLALHEAVLPGWVQRMDTLGNVWLFDHEPTYEELPEFHVYIHGNPARAWLLTILSALIEQEQQQ